VDKLGSAELVAEVVFEFMYGIQRTAMPERHVRMKFAKNSTRVT
jgi:hypothetical protein